MSAASVWKDQEFTNELEALLSKMQDELTDRIAQLAIKSHAQDDLPGLVSTHSYRVLGSIVNYSVVNFVNGSKK